MVAVGGIADAFALLLILAGLGMVLIAALALTFLLKLCGVRFHKAFMWGFGIPMAGFAGSLVYVTMLASERPERDQVPLQIPLPQTTVVG